MTMRMEMRAEARDRAGKGAARAARRAGRVPAVVYGGKETAQPITIDPIELLKGLNTGKFLSTVVTLDLGGEKTRTIPRDVQLHPVTDKPLHVDFFRLTPGSRIDVAIPVTFVNEEECPGLKRGGVLNVVRHEVSLNVPADAIPEEITADLKGYKINDTVHISSIALPQGAKPTITDRDFAIANIVAPSGLVVDDEDEDAATEEEAKETEAEADAAEAAEGEGEDGKGEEA